MINSSLRTLETALCVLLEVSIFDSSTLTWMKDLSPVLLQQWEKQFRRWRWSRTGPQGNVLHAQLNVYLVVTKGFFFGEVTWQRQTDWSQGKQWKRSSMLTPPKWSWLEITVSFARSLDYLICKIFWLMMACKFATIRKLAFWQIFLAALTKCPYDPILDIHFLYLFVYNRSILDILPNFSLSY